MTNLQPLRLLFIMDPIERIDTHRDTTYALMLAAQERNWHVAYTRREWIWHSDGRAFCRWSRVSLCCRGVSEAIMPSEPQESPIEDHDVVLVRTDPPFDMEYVKMTWLLDTVDASRTFIMNSPSGIRGANEKLLNLHFPKLAPPQIVTRDMHRLEEFMKETGGSMVVKPLDWMGGYGVFVVSDNDRNRGALIEISTRNGQDLVIAQEYLPKARFGDKRILLLDGEVLGALMRVPAEGEHRGNIHVGAKTKKAGITENDKRICETIAPTLRENGLYFVGIDVIGDHLTEINVTSPTGIREIDRLNRVYLESRVMDFIEEKAPCFQGS